MFSKYPEEKTIDTNNYKSITSRVPAQPRRTHTQSFVACQYPSTSTPRADITIRASVHRVCTKKTVKKTVRSNCNPDLLSASFGPSQRLHISVHHIHIHVHLYTRCPTARSPPLWRSILSALFPPPFLCQTSSSLNPSHPTPFYVLTLSQRTEDHTPGDKASSYPLSLSLPNWREWFGLFVDFLSPKTTQVLVLWGGGWKGNFSFPKGEL